MTYIVKDECIKCKLTDCVEVCPVDCFYEGENMLVIKYYLNLKLLYFFTSLINIEKEKFEFIK